MAGFVVDFLDKTLQDLMRNEVCVVFYCPFIVK